MIGLVTDSNTQIPPVLRDRYDITIVPLSIVIDGTSYLEGEGLTHSDFLTHMRTGATMSTAAPSPGQFARTYTDLAAAGADSVVSVHIGSGLSATFGSARLAAQSAPISVELVDTGTASFAAGCCVWAAAEALRAGQNVVTAAAAARRAAARIGNVFVASSLDLARGGGRLAAETGDQSDPSRAPVMALIDNQMQVIGEVHDELGAITAVADYLDGWIRPDEHVRVGVGDTDNPELADRLAASLQARTAVNEVVRYLVGPSVAVHTGLGTVGAVWAVV